MELTSVLPPGPARGLAHTHTHTRKRVHVDDSTGKWGRALGSHLNAPALVQSARCGPSKAQGNKQTKNQFQSGGCSRGPRLGCCRLLCQTHPASLEAGSGNQWQRRRWDRVTSDDPHSPATQSPEGA